MSMVGMNAAAGYGCGPAPPLHHWDFGLPVAPQAFGVPPALGMPVGSSLMGGPAGSQLPDPYLYTSVPPPAGSDPNQAGTGDGIDRGNSNDSVGSLDDGQLFSGSMVQKATEFWESMQRQGDEAIKNLPTLLSTVQDTVDSGKKRVGEAASKIKTRGVFGLSAADAICSHDHEERSTKRVLVVAPGFGLERDPRQAHLVRQAGFQVHFATNVPNPEQPGFQLDVYLPLLAASIREFRPNVIVSASKGGAYLIALWQSGLWRGPSVMINAHPHLQELPEDVPLVLAQGSNDDIYPKSRAEMESIMSSGSCNRCFLYWTGDSGKNSAGQCARVGDNHEMESLLTYDCLPRLIDAAMCRQGPEMHMIWSWRNQLSKQRLAAEQWLSYCPEELQRLWSSSGHKGLDTENLFEVPVSSQEFHMVADIFQSNPVVPAAYQTPQDEAWNSVRILRVDRVENGWQEEGSAKPYYAALRRAIEDQGARFQPGVHTRWVFHGTEAIESIISNPLAGFQPLASGARLGAVWGSGTYFARDAKYVFGGNFCQPAADGTRQMLMCLAMTGFPCLGHPEQRGVLPFRHKPHRYNSSVDSLSSPEIFIVQHPSAAYPAYLITFA